MSERDELIDYAKIHYCDMIPYDDPDYEKNLQEISENYADMMLGIIPWPDIEEGTQEQLDDDLPF